MNSQMHIHCNILCIYTEANSMQIDQISSDSQRLQIVLFMPLETVVFVAYLEDFNDYQTTTQCWRVFFPPTVLKDPNDSRSRRDFFSLVSSQVF